MLFSESFWGCFKYSPFLYAILIGQPVYFDAYMQTWICKRNDMKLRTRLIIAFCAMVFGPIFLFAMYMLGYGAVKGRSIERNFGVELSPEYIVNSVQTISESTNEIWSVMDRQVKEDPEMFLNFSFLQKLNEQLEDKLSYLLLVKDNEIYYQGEEGRQDNLVRQLPEYDEEEDTHHAVYIGGENRSLVKKVDIRFSDGSKGSAYIITKTSAVMPGFMSMLWAALFCILLILVLTAAGMTVWIYRGINTPTVKLREAAKKITSGDLDFSLHAEGEDEISDLTRDFEMMRQRLKQSEEEKERFDKESRELISNISHDLKTPITTIKGYVEGIMDGVADTPEKMDRYIKTIYNKANDMDQLINELTFYSRIDTNRIPYSFIRLNVKDYFDDCAEELGMDLEDRGIRFTYENHVAPDVRIIADPEQLKRVINNIVNNSVKYFDKLRKEINLRVLDAGEYIHVDLEDNGKGIEAKDLASIFDRFYRTDEARMTSEGGSGIGLSIVKKIIEDHNGRIWAGSKPGYGTIISFMLRKYLTDAA